MKTVSITALSFRLFVRRNDHALYLQRRGGVAEGVDAKADENTSSHASLIFRNSAYSNKHNGKVVFLIKIYYLCTMITKEQVEKFLEDFSLKV
ncbi:MAG: hypothetical protein K2F93_03145, partial [Muribaculaceae bacterium]|nr:hypothetical protein [Muribaculaceae bacterium]